MFSKACMGACPAASKIAPVDPKLAAEPVQVARAGTARVTVLVPDDAVSPYKGAKWSDVFDLMSERFTWEKEAALHMSVYTHSQAAQQDGNDFKESYTASDMFVAVDARDESAQRSVQAACSTSRPINLVMDSAPELEGLTRLGGLPITKLPGGLMGLVAKLPGSVGQAARLWPSLLQMWYRRSSDDLAFLLMLAINDFVTPVPSTQANMGDLQSFVCMCTKCRQQIVDCVRYGNRQPLTACERVSVSDQRIGIPSGLLVKIFDPSEQTSRSGTGSENGTCFGLSIAKLFVECNHGDPQCKTALDQLAACGINDQVCSYRVIASYESTLLEQFSLCILQKHNCLRNYADIPMTPDPAPLTAFQGQTLTHDIAEDIFVGHLAPSFGQPFSWKVVCGKNPAYDFFPCQTQLFYRVSGKKNQMWYDPIFKVKTLDGREVWRRRHYRVRRGKAPGTFHFSVLDNGVTSSEFWRIMDCADDFEWSVFYYSGAASAAGITYRGALICTSTGEWPTSEGSREQIDAALGRCGIRIWEMFDCDNCDCADAPLSVPEYGDVQWRTVSSSSDSKALS